MKKAAGPRRGRGATLAWGVHSFGQRKILIALDTAGLCWAGIDCAPEDFYRSWPGAAFVRDDRSTKRAARDIAGLWPRRMDALSVPVVLAGTEFQLKVWKQLLRIPAGQTRTYGEVARAIGAPRAVRAVGSAVGQNPVSIVVPCHRVVNGDGRTVNYAWGPHIKTELLEREMAA